MKASSKKAKVEAWGLDRIRPHPHQSKVPLAAADVERAAAELRRDGQREPLDVLPDGTLLVDVVIVEAARRLGWTEIRVRVRHDLDRPRDADVAFLAAVGRRPGLGPIWRTVLSVAAYWVERGQVSAFPTIWEVAEILQRVATVLGRNASERTCRRYYRLALAPVEVQAAVDRGDVTLVQGERVSHLPARVQQRIAARIAAGEDAGAVVAEFASPRTGRHRKPGDALNAFCKSLERGLADLDGRLTQPSPRLARRHRDVLARAGEAVRVLLAHADRPDADPPFDIGDLAAELAARKGARHAPGTGVTDTY